MMKYKINLRVLNSDDSPNGVSVVGFALKAVDPFIDALVAKDCPCSLKLTLLSMFYRFAETLTENCGIHDQVTT